MKKVLLLVMLTLFAGFSLEANAQRMKVSGQVTYADDGTAVIGAVVSVVGTSTAVHTDLNGMYEITIPASVEDKQLKVTYSGVRTVTRSVTSNGEVINFQLEADAQAIEGVVVTGYGNVETASYAGSASVVNNEKLKDVPTTSVTSRLAGSVAGLTITSTSGQPGAVESIRIRGMGSINAGNDPLYVIDGVPMTSGDASGFTYSDAGTSILSTLNPNDIESMTVIKDAAAASLYGSRAANGVIVITTKSGSSGKTQFNVKYDVGFSDMAIDWRPTLSGSDRRDILELGLFNYAKYGYGDSDADAQAFAESYIDNYASEPSGGYTDWKDLLFRTGISQNLEASVSGGNDKTRFFASMSYNDQEGIVYNQSYDRITGRVKVDHKSGIFSLNASTMVSSVDQQVAMEGTGFASPFMAVAMTVSPSDYAYNEDGSINITDGFSVLGGADANPIWERELNYETNTLTRSMSNVSAQLDFFEGFALKQTLAYDYLNSDNQSWWDPRSNNGEASEGVMQIYNITTQKLNSQTMATYDNTFADVHRVSALASFEAEKNSQAYTYTSGSGYPSYLKPAIYNAATTSGSSAESSNTLLSIVAKADYTYDNKLFIGGSFRRDGSSRLAPEERWGNFWSVASYWRMSQEDWWHSSGIGEVLTEAKLRASYGENGTQPSSWYGWQGTYGFGYNYNGIAGSAQDDLGAEFLTWERNLTTNIGLDLRFIDRINVSLDLYNRDTKDLILDQSISSTTGFTTMLTNVGSLNNKGWELAINADVLRNEDFYWNLGINLAQNKNTLTSLNSGVDELINTFTINRVGESYYSYYMYEYAGVDSETGAESFYKNTENSDGTINRETTTDVSEAQKVITGTYEPTITGGFTSQFSYKWIDFSFTFTFSLGGSAYDAASWINSDGGTYNYLGNVPSYYNIDDTWQNPGDDASLPIFQFGSSTQISDRWMFSTDHLRLKNLTLGFTAPSAWTNAIRLTKARLYVAASNLWTLKHDECVVDPEVPIGGICYFEAPAMRTITVGIEIGF